MKEVSFCRLYDSNKDEIVRKIKEALIKEDKVSLSFYDYTGRGFHKCACVEVCEALGKGYNYTIDYDSYGCFISSKPEVKE